MARAAFYHSGQAMAGSPGPVAGDGDSSGDPERGCWKGFFPFLLVHMDWTYILTDRETERLHVWRTEDSFQVLSWHCGISRSGSGLLGWQQAPIPAEPPCRPLLTPPPFHHEWTGTITHKTVAAAPGHCVFNAIPASTKSSVIGFLLSKFNNNVHIS